VDRYKDTELYSKIKILLGEMRAEERAKEEGA
jgi:hypothetical protein